MPDKPLHIDWEQLITILEKPEDEQQKLIGTLTEDEREALGQLQQMREDPLLTAALELDTDQAWENTRIRLQKKAPVRYLRRRWVAAASILVLIGAGWLFWQLRFSRPAYQSIAEGMSGHVPSRKVQLVTAEGRTVDVAGTTEVKEKDGTTIQLQQSTIDYTGSKGDKSDEALLMNTLIVPRGYLHEVVLSDGSRVWLNADSRLRYPVHFGKGERRVELEGEAYFEVKHSAEWPFIVRSKNTDVQVLGTSFNIEAYGPAVATTLVTGKVQVRAASGAVTLTPDEQVVVGADQRMPAIKKVTADDWVSWKDDELVMNNLSLEELAVRLERRYDVTVGFGDEKLKKEHYYAAVHLTNNIVDILESLQQTGNIRFVVKDQKILILPAL